MSKKNPPEAKDRRTMLKGLVAGSAIVTGAKSVPEQWSKPLTNAVVLPSHAVTTSRFGDKYAGDSGQSDDVSVSDRLGAQDGPQDAGDYGADDVVGLDGDNLPNDAGADNPYN